MDDKTRLKTRKTEMANAKDQTWIAKIDNEWSPNDFERWKFGTLSEMLDFLKEELAEGCELEGYDFDEFFTELEEEAEDEGCAIRTLKNGSLEVFACSAA